MRFTLPTPSGALPGSTKVLPACAASRPKTPWVCARANCCTARWAIPIRAPLLICKPRPVNASKSRFCSAASRGRTTGPTWRCCRYSPPMAASVATCRCKATSPKWYGPRRRCRSRRSGQRTSCRVRWWAVGKAICRPESSVGTTVGLPCWDFPAKKSCPGPTSSGTKGCIPPTWPVSTWRWRIALWAIPTTTPARCVCCARMAAGCGYWPAPR